MNRRGFFASLFAPLAAKWLPVRFSKRFTPQRLSFKLGGVVPFTGISHFYHSDGFSRLSMVNGTPTVFNPDGTTETYSPDLRQKFSG